MTLEICRLEEAARAAGVFSRDELAQLRAFKVEKRRLEWAAGRLAAKRLLQERLLKEGVWVALADIAVGRRESGRPFIRLAGSPDPEETAEPYPISISHSRDRAVCVLGPPRSLVGADLERIARREPSWLALVAHPEELTPALEESAPLQTALWTLKEAVLKTLGVGLGAGLWDVRLIPEPAGPRLELRGAALNRWEAFGRPRIEFSTETYHDFCLTSARAFGPVAQPGGVHGIEAGRLR